MNKLSALALIAALGAGTPMAVAHAQDTGVDAGAEVEADVDAAMDAAAEAEADEDVDLEGSEEVDVEGDMAAEGDLAAEGAVTDADVMNYTFADIQTALEGDAVDVSDVTADTEIVVVGTADLEAEGDATYESVIGAEGAPDGDALAEAGANEHIAAAIELQGYTSAENEIVALWWETDTTLVVVVDTME